MDLLERFRQSIIPGNVPEGPVLPPWLRRALPFHPDFARTRALVEDLSLNTVCQSARCPNRWECWSHRSAAFMIAGNRCTRACGFCAVDTSRPLPPDPEEPQRLARAARELGLRHLVITAVARDDLPDGGSTHFARAITAVRSLCPETGIEALIPDFKGNREDLDRVLRAGPDILNHNLETVERLTSRVRFRATYRRSLELLRRARERAHSPLLTKSGLMLGLGETEDEVLRALEDLRGIGCDMLTLGQYLRPSPAHLPVEDYLAPEVFERWGEQARGMGFLHVASAPLVRSSYHAEESGRDALRRLLEGGEPPR